MAGRLKDKVAIVTGAGSRGPGLGNGKATAVLFAREGAKVLCVDAEMARAQETTRMISDEGNVAEAFEHFRPRRRPLRIAALLLTDHLSRSWRTSALLAAFPARPHRRA